MKYVAEEMNYCEKCGKTTLHRRNSKKVNWLMHLLLIIVTAGLWIIPMLLILFLGIEIGGKKQWICSECGAVFGGKSDVSGDTVLLTIVVIFVVGIVAAIYFQ